MHNKSQTNKECSVKKITCFQNKLKKYYFNLIIKNNYSYDIINSFQSGYKVQEKQHKAVWNNVILSIKYNMVKYHFIYRQLP